MTVDITRRDDAVLEVIDDGPGIGSLPLAPCLIVFSVVTSGRNQARGFIWRSSRYCASSRKRVVRLAAVGRISNQRRVPRKAPGRRLPTTCW